MYPLSEIPQQRNSVWITSIIFCKFGSSRYLMIGSRESPSLMWYKNELGNIKAIAEITTSPMNRNKSMVEYWKENRQTPVSELFFYKLTVLTRFSKKRFSLSAPIHPAKLIKKTMDPRTIIARDMCRITSKTVRTLIKVSLYSSKKDHAPRVMSKQPAS